MSLILLSIIIQIRIADYLLQLHHIQAIVVKCVAS